MAGSSLFLALLASAGAQPGEGPMTLAEERAELQGNCEGGRVVAFAEADRSTDFNGDGVADILSFGGGNAGCLSADPAEDVYWGMVGCPAAGCFLTLYLSGPNGHRAAWRSGVIQSWRIDPGPRPIIRTIDVYACDGGGSKRCEITAQWNGRAMAERRLRIWDLERSTPPDLSPAWQVGSADDGTRVVAARAKEGGLALNLRCRQGAPVLTLFPTSRQSDLSSVTLEARGGRAALAMRRNDDGTWSAAPGADAIGLLTGRASEARLIAGTTTLATVSLVGSTRAIGDTLASCAPSAPAA